MIRRNEVNHSLAQRPPQFLAIFAAANRRSALAKRCAVGDRFSSEMQIVRACLDGDGKTLCTRRAQVVERQVRRQMHDMQAKSKFAA